MSVNNRKFRDFLGQFATGVTVVTMTDASEENIGITINSFTSLSLEPPMVLFCLDKSAAKYQQFINAKFFCVNILSESQEEVSKIFSKQANNLSDGIYLPNHTNSFPIIKDTVCYIGCETANIYDGGDHSIITGRVIELEKIEHDKNPLIYFRGKYTKLQERY